MLGFSCIAVTPLAATEKPWSPGDVIAVRAATEDYETYAGDDPADIIFHGTLLSPLRFERSLLSGSGLGSGTVAVSYGEAELVNDSEYDDVHRQFDISGRPVTIRVGTPDWRHADFVTLFDGTASGWLADDTRLRVKLRDWLYRLETPLESRTFAGTGGLEGPTDLEGKRIPVSFGWCCNVTPAGVSYNDRLFRVHDGPVRAITAVYTKGAVITPGPDYPSVAALLAADVADTTYATCLAEGYFRLGLLYESDRGAVTADVQGAVVDGVFLESTAQIVTYLLTQAGIAPERIGATPAALWPLHAPVGYYAGTDDTDTAADAVARLLGGCACAAGFTRRGVWAWWWLRNPEGAPVAEITEAELIEAPTPIDLPDDVWPPPWRWRVAYDRCWTTQTELAGQVTDARKAWLKEARRLAEAVNATTKAFYAQPNDPDPIEAYFRDEADARRLAAELEAQWGTPRGLYRLQVGLHAFARDLGETVTVSYPRGRLAAGPLGMIVAISEDAEDAKTEMTVLVA